MQIRDKLFIGGQWVAPHGRETIDVHNAGNGEVMGRIPAGDAADADAAVKAARSAFDSWSNSSPASRAEFLEKISAGLKARADELARAGFRVAGPVSDLERAIERATRAGVAWDDLIVDPGFGFGKAPVHNLALLAGLGDLRVLARPILLGTSRKSTLGMVLDLPPEERLEATLATTALAIAEGVDIVRVHDVRPNVRVARMSDAVIRGGGIS